MCYHLAGSLLVGSNQCITANDIPAIIYDDMSSQKGQFTMLAASEPDAFDCDALMTTMNGIVTIFAFAPPVQGATVFASLIRDAPGS